MSSLKSTLKRLNQHCKQDWTHHVLCLRSSIHLDLTTIYCMWIYNSKMLILPYVLQWNTKWFDVHSNFTTIVKTLNDCKISTTTWQSVSKRNWVEWIMLMHWHHCTNVLQVEEALSEVDLQLKLDLHFTDNEQQWVFSRSLEVCVCVCVCVWERERERECRMKTFPLCSFYARVRMQTRHE